MLTASYHLPTLCPLAASHSSPMSDGATKVGTLDDKQSEGGCSGATAVAVHSSPPPLPPAPHSSVSPSDKNGSVDDSSFAFRAFVPWTVESFLLARSQSGSQSASTSISRPCMSSYVGSLLFVDISGFTALSERLSQQGAHGLELLSEHLNRYFTLIVDTIHQHGGDVVKFAGDALLCLFAQQWPSESEGNVDEQQGDTASIDGDEEEEEEEEGVEDADEFAISSSNPTAPRRSARSALILHTHRACRCAVTIHSTLDYYSPVPSCTLRLHSAISSGPLFGLHVGGWKDRWEFLLEGDPLKSLGDAMHVSEKGQIVIHRSALELVDRWVKVQPMPDSQESNTSGGGASSAPTTSHLPLSSAHAPTCMLLVGIAPTPPRSPASSRPANLRKPHLTIVVQQTTSLLDSPRLLNRAAQLVTQHGADEGVDLTTARARCELAMRGYVPSAILARVASGHAAWLAEFRRVTTLFILLPDLSFGASGQQDTPGGADEMRRGGGGSSCWLCSSVVCSW